MGICIVIVSGKGGTGKTTTTAAVAGCLAALGHKTLAVDCDAGLRNLDISLGMSDFAVADISDIAEGRFDVAETARGHPRIPNLFFLPAPAGLGPEALDPDAIAAIFEEAREEYEFIVVDAPAGIGAGFTLAAFSADIGVIVTLEDPAAVRDAAQTAAALVELGLTEPRLLVNRVSRRALQSLRASVDDIVDRVGARLIGLVREDPLVSDAAGADTPLILHETDGAARDFLDVARRLCDEEIPIR